MAEIIDAKEVLEFLQKLKAESNRADFIPQMTFYVKAKTEKNWRDSGELARALKFLAKRGAVRIGDNWEIYL